jgi:hypothetical protein
MDPISAGTMAAISLGRRFWARWLGCRLGNGISCTIIRGQSSELCSWMAGCGQWMT